jgi:hypothetical protein
VNEDSTGEGAKRDVEAFKPMSRSINMYVVDLHYFHQVICSILG